MLKSDFSKDGNLKTERLKFQKIYNVSRGTLKLFDEYHNFLIKKIKALILSGLEQRVVFGQGISQIRPKYFF